MGEELDIPFIQVIYTLSRVILALFTKQVNARWLIPQLLSLLIWIVKIVDLSIVKVELLEHWQWLKIYGILVNRYLSKRKMELLRQKIESSIGIQLKTPLR